MTATIESTQDTTQAGGVGRSLDAAVLQEPPVLELDVTDEGHLAGLADQVREHVDGLDGVVHSIAYGNPETLLGGKFLTGPWDDVAQAVDTFRLVTGIEPDRERMRGVLIDHLAGQR